MLSALYAVVVRAEPDRLHDDGLRVYRQRRAGSPIVAFDTAEGLLLADGYHRVAAVYRHGLERIKAEVHCGSRYDALQYAATVGAAQCGISPDGIISHIQQRSEDRWIWER